MARRLKSHLAANAVAYLALFLALGGTSYAVAKLPANSVGAKQIKPNAVGASEVKNFSLLAQDFKRGQLPAGPRGDPGAKGEPGAAGPPGARGPSDGFGAFFGDESIPASQATPFSLADIDLPAGSYIVTGTMSVRNGVDAQQGLTCGIGSPGLTDLGEPDFAVDSISVEIGASPDPNTNALVLIGGIQLSQPANLSLDCSRSGAVGSGGISFEDIDIGALQVGTLHPL